MDSHWTIEVVKFGGLIGTGLSETATPLREGLIAHCLDELPSESVARNLEQLAKWMPGMPILMVHGKKFSTSEA